MSFRPPIWATMLTVFAVSLFTMLSWWQVQRGQLKADIIARQGDMEQATTQVNDSGVIPTHGRRVELRGRWLASQQIFLDNQTHQQTVGVHVLTPIALSGTGQLMLVNRGWKSAPLDRQQAPEAGALTEGEVTVIGYWRSLPRAGLAADDGQCADMATAWPLLLNYPSYALLSCLYQDAIADGVVLLDPSEQDGFVRIWNDLGIPPQRHYGYSFQWGALALTALLLYLFLNFRRSSQ